jgi:chitodextrinase
MRRSWTKTSLFIPLSLFLLEEARLSFASFTNVTLPAGVFSTGESRGAAWADYDNDGCVDLYVTQVGAPNHLYRNNCNGTFTDVASEAGVANPAVATGAAWADYDSDGDPDLYVGNQNGANALYRNNGDGTFTDVAAALGVDDIRGTAGVSWADYDGDGDPDLFIANRHVNGLTEDLTDGLYRNDGAAFTDVAPLAGIAGSSTRLTYMGVWFDYDADGDPDLYLAVDYGNDVLYRNNGDGTFSDVSAAAGVSDPQHGMGIAVGDYNEDGCLDVLSTNNTTVDDLPEFGPSVLYSNHCDGTFSNVSEAAGILDRKAVEWGVSFVDYDNDADLDLGIVAGGLLSEGQPNVLYRNAGGFFTDVTDAEGAADVGAAYGSAWADYDNDGDLDWFVANERGGSNVLLRNDGPTGNFVKVTPLGAGPNTHGVGTRVELTTSGKTQIRIIQAGQSFESAEEPAAYFGLGEAVQASRIRMLWPSGAEDMICNRPSNRRYELSEGAAPPAAGNCPADSTKPTSPVISAVTAAGPSRMAISWTAASDANGVAGYTVYRAGQAVADRAGLQHTEAALSPNTQYCYAVTAWDAAGNESDSSNEICAVTGPDTTAPFAPSNLTATVLDARTIQLIWGIPSDDVGAANYQIYRDGALIGEAPALVSPPYQDTGLAIGTTYCYTVRAVDASGNTSGDSNQACAAPVDTLLPSAPTDLEAVGVGSTSVELAWQASSDDVGVAGYRIFRGAEEVGQPATTSFADTGLAPGTGYTYTVVAVDAAGNISLPSESVDVTTAASGGGGGGFCFIATAAFGSPMAPQVQWLREFRDRYLASFEWGRKFIEFYNTHSPSLAETIRGHEGLRAGVRLLLWPTVGLAWFVVKTSFMAKWGTMLGLMFVIYATYSWRRSR